MLIVVVDLAASVNSIQSCETECTPIHLRLIIRAELSEEESK